MNFYICKKCGNVVELVEKHGGTLVCCGQKMDLLNANTEEAAVEKHIPAVEVQGNILNVVVGEVLHPSLEKHYIGFIVVKAGDLVMRHNLTVPEEPRATFCLGDYKGEVEVYEWCNLHGLWKTTVIV